jgi:uncharacterized protein YbaR (Trm112 family)
MHYISKIKVKMKRSTLELLCCPHCQAALTLRDERGDGIVDEGDLFCPHCERSFLIKNGIAHFISTQVFIPL